MLPYCDSMDRSVVRAEMKGLNTSDVRTILPFVPQEAEFTETRFPRYPRPRPRRISRSQASPNRCG